MIDFFRQFSNARLRTVLLLGFASGLPLALSGSTLQAWYTVSGVDLVTIGFLGLVGQPYVYKFLWAPLMDRYAPAFLGRRRGWMFVTQLLLLCAIFSMAGMNPVEQLGALAILALTIAFLSASQDIAVDAYRTDIHPAKERAAGVAVYVTGYRVAMLVSGSLALVLADYVGWAATFMMLAAMMTVGMAASFFGPIVEEPQHRSHSLLESITQPLAEFFSRRHAVALIVFIVLYKLGDAFAGTLSVSFLLRGLGFSLADVGLVTKVVSLVATLLGVFLGALLMSRLGLFRSLMLFGVLQGVTNLGFAWLAMSGKSYIGMAVVVGLENLSGGMGTAALVALLMALCDVRYTATQFALLSAAAAVGRVFVGPAAGVLVESIGWAPFFMITFATTLPGLLLLWWIRDSIDSLNQQQ